MTPPSYISSHRSSISSLQNLPLDDLLENSNIRNATLLFPSLYTRFIETPLISEEGFIIAPQRKIKITNRFVIEALRDILSQAQEEINSDLDKIKFKNCEFDLITWSSLLAMLKNLNIQSATFESCNLADDLITQLTHQIKKETVFLQSLSILKQENINPYRLLNFLEANKSLKQLTLNEIQLKDEDIVILKRAIEQHPCLEEFHLNDNHMTSQGATEIIYSACKSKTLKRLHLNNNPIEPEKFKIYQALARRIKPELQLSLSENPNNHDEASELDLLIQVLMPCWITTSPQEIMNQLVQHCSLFDEVKRAVEPTQVLLDKIYNYPFSLLRESLFSQIIQKSFKKQMVPSDGNCLFSTFVFLLNLNHSHSLDYVLSSSLKKNNRLFQSVYSRYKSFPQAHVLRLVVADYIKIHPKKFEKFIECNQDETEERALEKYCAEMEKTTTWGGEIEIQAICDLFKEMGEPLPPLVILDLSKKPRYLNGKFEQSNILNRQNNTNESPFFIYRSSETHFSPLTLKTEGSIAPESHALHPLQLSDECRKALVEFSCSLPKIDHLLVQNDKTRPLSTIVEELDSFHHYLLHFVISKYLRENKMDFQPEILDYKNQNFVSLLEKINSHYRRHHLSEFSEKKIDDMEITMKVFEAMGAPIIIVISDIDAISITSINPETTPQGDKAPLIFIQKNKEGLYEKYNFSCSPPNSDNEDLEDDFVFVEEKTTQSPIA